MHEVRITHSLPRAEVRRRMAARVDDLGKLLPGDRGSIAAAWTSENQMAITVSVMGQVIECAAMNEPAALVIRYALPRGMGFIAPMVDTVIRKAGDKLLLERPK